MSVAVEIKKAFPADVVAVKVEDSTYHGEKAVQVRAELTNRKIVEGIFTTDDKDSFGGVEFNSRKDVVALMVHKIRSVLNGTAE
jgi:hypothetical protein